MHAQASSPPSAQADPGQRITVQGIMQHPFFLKDLPAGSLERGTRLLGMADLLLASYSTQREADIVSICARACRKASRSAPPSHHGAQDPHAGVEGQEQVRQCVGQVAACEVSASSPGCSRCRAGCGAAR